MRQSISHWTPCRHQLFVRKSILVLPLSLSKIPSRQWQQFPFCIFEYSTSYTLHALCFWFFSPLLLRAFSRARARVCVCVCVLERWGWGGGGGGGERQRDRQRSPSCPRIFVKHSYLHFPYARRGTKVHATRITNRMQTLIRAQMHLLSTSLECALYLSVCLSVCLSLPLSHPPPPSLSLSLSFIHSFR